jgi:hypothetical protein
MKKRVNIPKDDTKALLHLAAKMREKHRADGDASPLKIMNWQEIDEIINDALSFQEQAERLRREMRMAFQLRDLRAQAVLGIVRNSRNILSGMHSEQMKALGEWGFDVMDIRSSSASTASASASSS